MGETNYTRHRKGLEDEKKINKRLYDKKKMEWKKKAAQRKQNEGRKYR